MHIGRTPAVLIIIAGVTFTGLTPASAHPVDELLQQVYVTPVGNVLNLDVELTPAAEIAVAFLGDIDRDNDGVISAPEADAHAASVNAVITVVVDGASVPLQLDNSSYPEERLMLGAAGTIVLKLHADLPPSTRTRVLVVTNAYAPTSSGGAINTTVQASVTPRPDSPITVGSIDRDVSGRTITVHYSEGALGGSASSASVATSDESDAAKVIAGIALEVGVAALLWFVVRRRGRASR